MPSTGEPLRERFLDALRAAIDGPRDASPQLDELRDASQALLDSHALQSAALAARDLQNEALRAVLAHLSLPILQVRDDTLCVPVFGELDGERTARLGEAALATAVARGARYLVIDLTCAVLTRDTPVHVARVFGLLDPLGVRGALSGVGPEVADALAHHPDALAGVRCFAELASALAAFGSRARAVG